MSAARDLCPQVHAFENLCRAFRQARCGKRDREEVAAFEYELEANLLQLQAELQQSIQSWVAHCRHARSYRLRRAVLSRMTF